MNKITTYGRVSTDVTTRDVNGRTVANFNVASNTHRKDENGQYGTIFYRVSVWGVQANTAASYLKKGNRIVVSGDLNIREYVAEGKTRYSVEIDNASFDLVETRAESGGTAAPAAPTQPGFVPAPAPAPAQHINPEDDLPF